MKLAFLLPLLATLPAAQSVLVVDDDGGPGVDHTALQAAVDAAAPGAILLVRNGVYTSATIDGKPLTLTAEVTGAVVVEDGLVVRNLAAGDTVTIREVGLAGSEPLRLEQNQGVVWVESALLAGDFGDTNAALIAEDCADVVVRNCALVGGTRGNGEGLRATGSTLHLYDTSVRGSLGGEYVFAGDGARLFDSFLFASDSSFEGGHGGESTCIHPTTGLPGGDGLVLDGSVGSQAFVENTTFVGGLGGPEPCGLPGPGPDGDAVVTVAGSLVEVTRPARGLTVSTPVRTDEVADVQLTGAPGELGFLLFGPRPAPLFLAGLVDSLLLPVPASTLFVGALDGAGTAGLQVTPSLPPGALGRTLFVQAFFFDLSAPPGAQLALATPSSVVVLDAAL